MKEFGFTPDEEIFDLLMDLLSETSDQKIVLQVFKEISNPTANHFASLLITFIKADEEFSLRTVFGELRDRNIELTNELILKIASALQGLFLCVCVFFLI